MNALAIDLLGSREGAGRAKSAASCTRPSPQDAHELMGPRGVVRVRAFKISGAILGLSIRAQTESLLPQPYYVRFQGGERFESGQGQKCSVERSCMYHPRQPDQSPRSCHCAATEPAMSGTQIITQTMMISILCASFLLS